MSGKNMTERRRFNRHGWHVPLAARAIVLVVDLANSLGAAVAVEEEEISGESVLIAHVVVEGHVIVGVGLLLKKRLTIPPMSLRQNRIQIALQERPVCR